MTVRIIGMLIFPRLTQLDMTGPYEVLARLPNTKVHLVSHTLEPITTVSLGHPSRVPLT